MKKAHFIVFSLGMGLWSSNLFGDNIHGTGTDSESNLTRNGGRTTRSVSYRKPYIESIKIAPDRVEVEGTTKYQITVKSDSPVNWLFSCLKSPVQGRSEWSIGSKKTFTKIDVNTYVYEGEIEFDKDDVQGTYKLGCVKVKNEDGEESPKYADVPIEFSSVTDFQVIPQTKKFRDLIEEVTLTVKFKSPCTPDELGRVYRGPRGQHIMNIIMPVDFKNVGENTYEFTHTVEIPVSMMEPSGEYSFKVWVRNKCNGTSAANSPIVLKNDSDSR